MATGIKFLVLIYTLAITCSSFSILEDVAELPSMFGNRIKHIVAIMFEYRSFDHFLGHLVTQNSKYDGCSPDIPTCNNPVNPTDPNSEKISVGFNAVYVQPGDPGHSILPTTHQLFGPNATNNGDNPYPPPMDGFIFDYSRIDQIRGL